MRRRPMTPTDDELRKEYFEGHVATLEQHGPIQFLTWAKPGTSNCLMWFLWTHGCLFVTGDLGNAIFRWHWSMKDIRELGKIDISYMEEKCEASEEGRRFKVWSVETFIKDLNARFDEEFKDGEPATDAQNEALQNICDAVSNLDVKHVAAYSQVILANHTDDMEEIFGTDWGEVVSGMGEEYALRMRLMHIGLMMAMEQIRNNEAKKE